MPERPGSFKRRGEFGGSTSSPQFSEDTKSTESSTTTKNDHPPLRSSMKKEDVKSTKNVDDDDDRRVSFAKLEILEFLVQVGLL